MGEEGRTNLGSTSMVGEGMEALQEAASAAKADKKNWSRMKKMAKHCQYSEALAMKGLEKASLMLLQAAEKKTHHMWFIQKIKANGKRDPRAYDNTSLMCKCIRGCKQTNKQCV